MAKCYNCGADISADDKLRLCDRCKSILLPFIKLTDASTSSAVARLISNERNLRARGVTDNGMDYLMRICEAHDREKIAEKARRETQKPPKTADVPAEPPKHPQKQEYQEIDLPLAPPMQVHRKPYGTVLTALTVLLILTGLGFCGWFAYRLLIDQVWEILCIPGAVTAFCSAAVCPPVKKLIHDVNEIKKQFR